MTEGKVTGDGIVFLLYYHAYGVLPTSVPLRISLVGGQAERSEGPALALKIKDV